RFLQLWTSEGNIVVGNFRPAAATPAKIIASGRLIVLLGAARTAKAAAARRAFAAAAQHAEVRRHNFKTGAFLAFFVLPFARLDAAFDENKRALLQILLSDLRLFAPHYDLVPFGALLALAIFVAVGFIGGHGKVGDGLSPSRVTSLRVAAQAADQ